MRALAPDDDLRARMVGRYALSPVGADAPTLSLDLFDADGALLGAIDGNDPTRMLYQGDHAFRPEAAPVFLITAIEMGARYAREHFDCPLPIRLETMDETKDCVMVTGNAAAACGTMPASGAFASSTPPFRPIVSSSSMLSRS